MNVVTRLRAAKRGARQNNSRTSITAAPRAAVGLTAWQSRNTWLRQLQVQCAKCPCPSGGHRYGANSSVLPVHTKRDRGAQKPPFSLGGAAPDTFSPPDSPMGAVPLPVSALKDVSEAHGARLSSRAARLATSPHHLTPLIALIKQSRCRSAGCYPPRSGRSRFNIVTKRTGDPARCQGLAAAVGKTPELSGC
jgi:hypothetical protein